MRNPTRLVIAFALASLLCQPPAFASKHHADNGIATPQIDIASQTFRLDNGLTVVVHEDHAAPLVNVNIWYHVGSKDEPSGKSRFAHLFEHLMFNGSENFDDDLLRSVLVRPARTVQPILIAPITSRRCPRRHWIRFCG